MNSEQPQYSTVDPATIEARRLSAEEQLTYLIHEGCSTLLYKISQSPPVSGYSSAVTRNLNNRITSNPSVPAVIELEEVGLSEHWIVAQLSESSSLRGYAFAANYRHLDTVHAADEEWKADERIAIPYSATKLESFIEALGYHITGLTDILEANERLDYSKTASDASQVAVIMSVVKYLANHLALLTNTYQFLNTLDTNLGSNGDIGLTKAKPLLGLLFTMLGFSVGSGTAPTRILVRPGAMNLAAVSAASTQGGRAFREQDTNSDIHIRISGIQGKYKSSMAVSSALNAIAGTLYKSVVRKNDPLVGSGIEYSTAAIKALGEGTTTFGIHSEYSRLQYRTGVLPTLCDATHRMDSLERSTIYPNILSILRSRADTNIAEGAEPPNIASTSPSFKNSQSLVGCVRALIFRVGYNTHDSSSLEVEGTAVHTLLNTEVGQELSPRTLIRAATELSNALIGVLYQGANGLNNVFVNPKASIGLSSDSSITSQECIVDTTFVVTEDTNADAVLLKGIQQLSSEAHRKNFGEDPTPESSLVYPTRTLLTSARLTTTVLKTVLFPPDPAVSTTPISPGAMYIQDALVNVSLPEATVSSGFGPEGDLAKQVYRAFRAEEAVKVSSAAEATAIMVANTSLGNKLFQCRTLLSERISSSSDGSSSKAVSSGSNRTVLNSYAAGQGPKSELRRAALVSLIENGISLSEVWGCSTEHESFKDKGLLRRLKYTDYLGNDLVDHTTPDSILHGFVDQACKKKRMDVLKAVMEERSFMGIGNTLSVSLLEDFRKFVCEWFGRSHSSTGINFFRTEMRHRGQRRTSNRVLQEEAFYTPSVETLENSTPNGSNMLTGSNSIPVLGISSEDLRSGLKIFGGRYKVDTIAPAIDARYKDINHDEVNRSYFHLVVYGALLEAMDAWVASREGKKLVVTEAVTSTRTMMVNSDDAMPVTFPDADILPMGVNSGVVPAAVVSRKENIRGNTHSRVASCFKSDLAMNTSVCNAGLATSSPGLRSLSEDGSKTGVSPAPTVASFASEPLYLIGTVASGGLMELNGGSLALSTEEESMKICLGRSDTRNVMYSGYSLNRSSPFIGAFYSIDASASARDFGDTVKYSTSEDPNVNYAEAMENWFNFEFRYGMFNSFEEPTAEFSNKKFAKVPFMFNSSQERYEPGRIVDVPMLKKGFSVLPVKDNLDIRDLSLSGVTSTVFYEVAEGFNLAHKIKTLTQKIV